MSYSFSQVPISEPAPQTDACGSATAWMVTTRVSCLCTRRLTVDPDNPCGPCPGITDTDGTMQPSTYKWIESPRYSHIMYIVGWLVDGMVDWVDWKYDWRNEKIGLVLKIFVFLKSYLVWERNRVELLNIFK